MREPKFSNKRTGVSNMNTKTEKLQLKTNVAKNPSTTVPAIGKTTYNYNNVMRSPPSLIRIREHHSGNVAECIMNYFLRRGILVYRNTSCSNFP